MNIDRINARVDGALQSNRRAEHIVIGMSVAIFVSGLSILFAGYWFKNTYIMSGGAVVSGFLYWPIREILKLRRDNILLQVLPVIVAELPKSEVIEELKKFTKHLRGKQ